LIGDLIGAAIADVGSSAVSARGMLPIWPDRLGVACFAGPRHK
jgi:hypothetical protein